MRDTVFYAWQSDLPNNCNRRFIRDAIERAIKKINAALGVNEALRPDQDTENVPGNPSITETIYEKIDSCRVFVPDISIVSDPMSKRPMPNPNVMIEYGRATKSLGDRFIVPVFNSAIGDWQTDRPFDMRHKQRPITYHLPADHTSDERKTARDELVKWLVRDISAVLRYGQPRPVPLPTREDFDSIREHYLNLRPEGDSAGRMTGFWCGLIPVTDQVYIDRPFEHPELFERAPAAHGRFANSATPLTLETMDLPGQEKNPNCLVMPAKAAGLRTWHRHCHDERFALKGDEVCRLRVERNGTFFLAAKTNFHNPAPALYVHWIMADVANALRIVDSIRREIGRSEVRYAIMLELRYDEHLDQVAPVESGEYRFGLLQDEWPYASLIVKSDPMEFGPFLVGQTNEFPQIMAKILGEIYMNVNRRPVDDFEFIM